MRAGFDASNYREGYRWLYGKIPNGYHIHHKCPVELEEWFASKGINVHDPLFLQALPEEIHLKFPHGHFDWNGAWRRFWKQHPDADASEICQFLEDLMRRAGDAFARQ